MVSALVAEVVLIAVAVGMALAVTVWATDMMKDKTEMTSATAGQVIDCSVADIDINSVYLNPGKESRVLVTNTGRKDNMTIKASLMVNNMDENATLLTALPVPGFNRAETKETDFETSGVIDSCEQFKRATVATECVAYIYDAAPTNC
ncbi:MAG: hypothetical protein ABIG30_02465 [Candidatus Aenigmatarchaeota archaeon]